MKFSPFDKEIKKQSVIDSGVEPDGLYLLNNESVFDYYVSKNNYLRSFTTPKNSFVYPTENDYDNGVFTRYFIRKRNDNSSLILEIDKDQFSTMSPTSGIDSNIYYAIQVDWKITGPDEDIVDSSGNIVVYGIKDTNDRTLQLKELEMPGIIDKLKNLRQFARRVK